MIKFFKNIWNACIKTDRDDAEICLEIAIGALKELSETPGRSGTAQKVRRIALAALEELK